MVPLDPVRFVHAHPMPTAEHATLLASYRLLLDVVGESVRARIAPQDGVLMFEDWELTRSAFIARMAGIVRHLGYLVPSYSRLDGFALARTLVDHVITFAWISAAPRERVPEFLRVSYKSQLARDKRVRERGEEPMLSPDLRERLSAYTRDVRTEMPRLPRRSREADEHWVGRAKASLPEELRIIGFERLHDQIYDNFSEFDHPTTLGLMTYVHEVTTPTLRASVDGMPQRRPESDLRPYRVSTFAFAEALIVSNLATGHPRLRPLREALGRIGQMHALERRGRLEVIHDEDGITIRDAGPPSP